MHSNRFGCLGMMIHPFRTTHMLLRLCMGKEMFKPGSRNAIRLQKAIEREEARLHDEADAEVAAENRKLLEGYDTMGTNALLNTDQVWEMEVEDWEETGG